MTLLGLISYDFEYSDNWWINLQRMHSEEKKHIGKIIPHMQKQNDIGVFIVQDLKKLVKTTIIKNTLLYSDMHDNISSVLISSCIYIYIYIFPPYCSQAALLLNKDNGHGHDV